MGDMLKFNLIAGVFLAFFLSGCATQGNSGLVALPVPQEKILCSDSDGGNNIYKLGFVSGPCADCEQIGAIGGNTDTCLSKKSLMEFYCADEGFTRKTVECQNGCLAGACVK